MINFKLFVNIIFFGNRKKNALNKGYEKFSYLGPFNSNYLQIKSFVI